MTNRFPLIVDSSALQIKELPNGDNIDMTNSGITSATSIGSTTLSVTDYASVGGALTVSGNLNANSLNVTGIGTLSVGTITNLTSTNANISGISTVGVITGATSIESTIYYGDGSKLSGVNLGVEILDEGSTLGSAVTSINFSGSDIAASVTGYAATITVTSTGGGGSGLSSTGIATAAIWSNPSVIYSSVELTEGNNNYGVFGPVTVAVGATVTVGAANTFVVV